MVQEQMDRAHVSPDSPPKKIYNPVTGKYYEIREHSGKYGGPGQIKGLWCPKEKIKQ
jgi:hypothetical protein